MLEITTENNKYIMMFCLYHLVQFIPDYVCMSEFGHSTHGCPSGVFSGMEMA